jgi:hypothetical protein
MRIFKSDIETYIKVIIFFKISNRVVKQLVDFLKVNISKGDSFNCFKILFLNLFLYRKY